MHEKTSPILTLLKTIHTDAQIDMLVITFIIFIIQVLSIASHSQSYS